MSCPVVVTGHLRSASVTSLALPGCRTKRCRASSTRAPTGAAGARAGGPVQSVPVLGSNTSLYGFAAALEGIEEATREVGFGMGFRALEALSPADMRDAVERAIEPAGALIVIAYDRAGALALECVPSEVRMVAMIQAPTAGTVPKRPSVWIDEFSAAKEATEYLLAFGHKKEPK